MCGRWLFVPFLFVVVLQGCRSAEEVPVVELRAPGVTEPTEEKAPGFEDLKVQSRAETVFLAPERAKECPKLEVATAENESTTIQPAKEGSVTLVVFWTVAVPMGRAAARYASQVRRRYGPQGVRVYGIAEKTAGGYKGVQEFLRSQGIAYPVYYDDFHALKEMSDAMGTRVAVPSIFIIDRARRVRFFRAGFSFFARTSVYPRARYEFVFENAPKGDRIRDYVETILKEK